MVKQDEAKDSEDGVVEVTTKAFDAVTKVGYRKSTSAESNTSA